MTLLLSVLRCPDTAVPEQRRVPGGDYTIGRGGDCDWVLQDPDGVLSRRHCVLEFRSGGWQVRDLSTNGTYLNHAAEPVGRDQVALLSVGDRLRVGSYEIELRVAQEAAGAAPGWGGVPAGAGLGGAAPAWAAHDAAADPGWDPLAPPLPRGGGAGDAAALPADFDPFATDPPMPDHRASVDDAFVPPRVVPMLGPAASAKLGEEWDLGLPPVSSGVGGGGGRAAPALDDWDLSPPPGAAAQRVQPPPPHRPSAAAVTPPVPGAHGPAPAAGLSDPFADEAPLVVPSAAAPVVVPSAAAPAGAGIAPACAVPPMRAAATPAPGPAAARMAGGGGGGDAAAGLAAFLAGAGLSPAVLQGQAATDPDAALRALGTAFRAIVAGLRALLIARADVKREFRIEQTLLRPAGNNPIKFAATDEAATLALASQGARGVGAVQETVADLTAHQVATLAATQAAARALLDRLAPAGLEAEVKGGGSLFGGGREKLLWDSYRKLHQQVVDQFEDDFDSAFGKAFARAYEQAVKRDAGR